MSYVGTYWVIPLSDHIPDPDWMYGIGTIHSGRDSNVSLYEVVAQSECGLTLVPTFSDDTHAHLPIKRTPEGYIFGRPTKRLPVLTLTVSTLEKTGQKVGDRVTLAWVTTNGAVKSVRGESSIHLIIALKRDAVGLLNARSLQNPKLFHGFSGDHPTGGTTYHTWETFVEDFEAASQDELISASAPEPVSVTEALLNREDKPETFTDSETWGHLTDEDFYR